MGTVEVKRILGEMPPVWRKEVAFFANILSLFYGNLTQIDILRREVGTLETYGSRLVPVLNLLFRGGSNLLILERKPDAALISYFQKDLGLSLPLINVLPHKDYICAENNEKGYSEKLKSFLRNLTAHSSRWLDGYVADRALERIAKLSHKTMVTSVEGSRRGNNKCLLYEHIRAEGLPVFDTYLAETPKDVQSALRELKGKGYHKAVLKSQIGASGIGMKKVNLYEDSEKVPDYIFYEGCCLVQGWLDGTFADVCYIGSPSVQMFLDGLSINLYDLTEQFLSPESVHEGNIVPPRFLVDKERIVEEILSQAEVAGKWLHRQGYRGTASCDFHLIKRGRRYEVRLCELNARVTGATYPSLLSRHFLPRTAWLMRNIRFSPPLKDTSLLGALDANKLLFRPGKKEGVLPFNLNFDTEGSIVKGQFLFLGQTTQKVCRLLEEVGCISPIRSNFDRD